MYIEVSFIFRLNISSKKNICENCREKRLNLLDPRTSRVNKSQRNFPCYFTYKNVKRRIHGPVISSTVITITAYIEKTLVEKRKANRKSPNDWYINNTLAREMFCE